MPYLAEYQSIETLVPMVTWYFNLKYHLLQHNVFRSTYWSSYFNSNLISRYSIAVSLGHVPALLPYISDSGVLIPERSIFSQLINLAVIVQLITFYVRWEFFKTPIRFVTVTCGQSYKALYDRNLQLESRTDKKLPILWIKGRNLCL